MTVTDRQAVVERWIEGLVGRRGIRHAVAAVRGGDEARIASAAAGPAAPDGPPMRADTPFHFASITKLYTATVVMQLWEQGRVDLDAALDTYLPHSQVNGIHRLDGTDHSARITIRHLLSHTSGLPDYFLGAPPGDASFGERIEQEDFTYTLDDVLDRVRQLPAHFPPQDPSEERQRARYSDTNFQLLGAVVAEVTGHTLQHVVEAQVLAPLELEDTWFAGRPRRDHPSRPAAMWAGDTLLDRPGAMASMAPEGGLVGTVADALAFLRALVAGELFQQQDTFALMRSHWNRFGLPGDRTAIMAPSWPIEYGLGIKRYQLPRLLNLGRRSPTLIGHTGATGSWLFWCPQHDLYLAGTVDQTTAAGVPYRLLPRLVDGLAA